MLTVALRSCCRLPEDTTDCVWNTLAKNTLHCWHYSYRRGTPETSKTTIEAPVSPTLWCWRVVCRAFMTLFLCHTFAIEYQHMWIFRLVLDLLVFHKAHVDLSCVDCRCVETPYWSFCASVGMPG